MDASYSAEIIFRSEEETAAFGARLARLLEPGDTILLSGPIGAGKTHLARSIIQARLAAAGLHEDVPSPTYTLVQVYSDGLSEIWHADLYRLSSVDEIVELGLDEAFENAIVLVEWPDRLGSAVPRDALKIELLPVDDHRRVRLTSASGTWERVSDCFAPAT